MKGKKHICIANKADCCGCSACYAACPRNAIWWIVDNEGFQYPVVDGNLCINCGICANVCPIQTRNQHEKTTDFYAFKHLEEEVREKSSSGGVFSAMAQAIVDRNGVIYGAAFDRDFAVKHIRTEDQSWMALRTAKYVQSDMGDIFRQVKADLNNGREVLFTGTPCQVEGLNHYLRNVDSGKLITVDLICHGVPSPGIWKDYLTTVSEKHNKCIGNVNFRNKNGCGWHDSTVKICDTNGTVLMNEGQGQALFTKLYFNHIILRPSCFRCQYANLNRAGDITIGDYWGVEKHHPELDDDRGVSLVMGNTLKGQRFLESLSNCQTVPITEEKCMQPNLKTPAEVYGERDIFWRAYQKYGFEIACKRIGFLEKNLPEKLLVFWIRVCDKVASLLRG